jgi:parallel beta-helix repeat protein
VRNNRALYNGHGIVVNGCRGCSVAFNAAHFNGLGAVTGHGIELADVDGSRIERNYATRNTPPQCVWDGGGTNAFSSNSCANEFPAGAWD